MCQEWRFLPGAAAGAAMKVDPSVSLRPKGPVLLKVERR
jgi:hypothetical protein